MTTNEVSTAITPHQKWNETQRCIVCETYRSKSHSSRAANALHFARFPPRSPGTWGDGAWRQGSRPAPSGTCDISLRNRASRSRAYRCVRGRGDHGVHAERVTCWISIPDPVSLRSPSGTTLKFGTCQPPNAPASPLRACPHCTSERVRGGPAIHPPASK